LLVLRVAPCSLCFYLFLDLLEFVGVNLCLVEFVSLLLILLFPFLHHLLLRLGPYFVAFNVGLGVRDGIAYLLVLLLEVVLFVSVLVDRFVELPDVGVDGGGYAFHPRTVLFVLLVVLVFAHLLHDLLFVLLDGVVQITDCVFLFTDFDVFGTEDLVFLADLVLNVFCLLHLLFLHHFDVAYFLCEIVLHALGVAFEGALFDHEV